MNPLFTFANQLTGSAFVTTIDLPRVTPATPASDCYLRSCCKLLSVSKTAGRSQGCAALEIVAIMRGWVADNRTNGEL